MHSFDPIKDYYQSLGVDRLADIEQIKRAYRDRARTSHPDLGGSPTAMRDLNEAYEVLSDPATRKAYDSKRGIAEEHWLPESKREAFRSESLGIRSPDKDLLWLTTRDVICAVLAVLWLLIVEEASPRRGMSVALRWSMRGLGIVALGVGILFGYAAHRLVQQQMSYRHSPRTEKYLSLCRSRFRAVIAGFLAFLILAIYLSSDG